jgi:uncharacterized repeat protein (TIGR03843 family)
MPEGPPDAAAVLDLLERGDVTLLGRVPRGSNATFLAEVSRGGTATLAIYKPERGERALWDFPPGLYRRETAAYVLAAALGWSLVPPTVAREGPLGPGSFQQFVRAAPGEHYFTLVERPEHREALARLCLFDLLANNADRKSGHCLLGAEGRLWAIDNALTFHAEPKLRTVIWAFGGEPVPAAWRGDVERVLGRGVPEGLAAWLDADERAALQARARAVSALRHFPRDPGGHAYPWPLV